MFISTGQFAFQQYNAMILYDWCNQNKEKWNIPFILVTSIIKPQQQCLSEQPELSHLNKLSCFRNVILFREEKRQAVSISVPSLAMQLLRLHQTTPTSYRHLTALTKYCMAVSQIKCKARIHSILSYVSTYLYLPVIAQIFGGLSSILLFIFSVLSFF